MTSESERPVMPPDLRSESERPVMPLDLFKAAIQGNDNVLIQRLGLQPEERREIEVRDNQTVQFELESATNFGDTLLHVLITKRHNELALKVFQRDKSLLLAQNKMLETPLHRAAKVGNGDVICYLIQSDPVVVLDALERTNKNGETALQISAKYGALPISVEYGQISAEYIHILYVGCELMRFGLRVPCKIINKMISPLYTAIDEGHTSMVKTMLQIEPTLAYAQFSNGMFPIHVAARMGNVDLIRHFIKEYPHCVELLDPHGRNLFHIAAEENQEGLFGDIYIGTNVGEMMINATDYEGNTPSHIAEMKGHWSIMRDIWKNDDFAETVQNNQGIPTMQIEPTDRLLEPSPSQLSASQLEKTTKDIDSTKISKYIGNKFMKWFIGELMELSPPPFENIWETAQFIGLGSVLITTVTFAAAFAIPGGYDQDHGTPVLGRKYAFRAFILANSLAFIQRFVSLITIMMNSVFSGQLSRGILFAIFLMGGAANCMVVAFGLGLYVMLAPVCLPMAILLLVISLFFGSPAKLLLIIQGQKYSLKNLDSMRKVLFDTVALYAVCCVFIFCLALL